MHEMLGLAMALLNGRLLLRRCLLRVLRMGNHVRVSVLHLRLSVHLSVVHRMHLHLLRLLLLVAKCRRLCCVHLLSERRMKIYLGSHQQLNHVPDHFATPHPSHQITREPPQVSALARFNQNYMGIRSHFIIRRYHCNRVIPCL